MNAILKSGNTMVRLEGVPVIYDEGSTLPAQATGFWRGKKIVVGPAFLLLPERQQFALLHHELGHCCALHMEKRVAMFVLALAPLAWVPWNTLVPVMAGLLVWGAAGWLARRQEFAADREAVSAGYAREMVEYLNRATVPGHDGSSGFYPSHAERVARIRSLMNEGDTPCKP